MTDNWSRKWASIPVRPETKKRVDAIGQFKETYDDIINKLIDVYVEKHG